MVAIEMQYPKIDGLLNIKDYWDWNVDFAKNHGIDIAANDKAKTPEVILEAACNKYELKDDFIKLKRVLTIAKDILLADTSDSEDSYESVENKEQKIRRSSEELKTIKSSTSINNNPISDSGSELNTRKSNNYRRRMYSYLKEIEENWDVIFGEKRDRVLVEDLLNKFAELVEKDLKEDYPADYQERINRFRSGAWLAQPKIMTINEKNRLNFNGNPQSTHDLFYYPEITKEKTGYINVWKKTLIQPFRKIPRERINDYMNFKK
jgi:hypothetical protein